MINESISGNELISMLERAGGIADELKQKLLNGIKKYIEQYSVSCEPGYGASLQPYVRTAQAMNAFLKEYPAPAYYKESVRKILWKWFDSAATENGLYVLDGGEYRVSARRGGDEPLL